MTLWDVLYGEFNAPTPVRTTVHKIGLNDTKFRYVPPVKRVSRYDGIPVVERLAEKAMQQIEGGFTTTDIAELAGMTKNRAAAALNGLFKRGLVTRTQHRKPGTRYYLFKKVTKQ